VPSRIVFLTDGPARKVKIGRREILLLHTTPRNMATAGRKTKCSRRFAVTSTRPTVRRSSRTCDTLPPGLPTSSDPSLCRLPEP
jgi:hypothetical protein